MVVGRITEVRDCLGYKKIVCLASNRRVEENNKDFFFHGTLRLGSAETLESGDELST